MKIGILTYHRSHNYGALLQAVALRQYIEDLGHEAYFVDYWPDYHAQMYNIFNKNVIRELSLLRKIKYIVKQILYYNLKSKRIRNFKNFIEVYIAPYCKPATERFDAVIYGSDQIWRKQLFLNDFNAVYFGANEIESSKKVSYAASMGKVNISKSDAEKIRKWLKGFDAISVRETDLKKELEKLQLGEIHLVSDPTLLLKADQWRKLMRIEENSLISRRYVLLYDLLVGSFNKEKVYEFAKERNLEVIELCGSISKMHYQENEKPLEDPKGMLSLIANADYVFTSSYHGLIFSLIFHKEFYVSFSENAGRAASILKYLGIPKRMVDVQLKNLDSNKMVYKSIDEKFRDLTKESKDFLKNTLS